MQPHETVAESPVDGVSPAPVLAPGTSQSAEDEAQLAPSQMTSDLAPALTALGPTLNVATSDEKEPASEPASPVAAALNELDGLENQPVANHVAVYDGVHAVLTNALSDIDKATG